MPDEPRANRKRKKAPGVRARVRAELTAEIIAVAREQLATEGAAGLSLRAIARELSMASSAIYRYFPSRDELLTRLIIDAYDALGAAVERADTACRRDDFAGRFIGAAQAVRSWAIENPHEYALIYGSPVPGYVAPVDTVDPATRVPRVLLAILSEHERTGDAACVGHVATADEAELARALRDVDAFSGRTVPIGRLARGIEAWGEIFGLVSLELFGHFHNAVSDPAVFFDHAAAAMAERVLGSAPGLRGDRAAPS